MTDGEIRVGIADDLDMIRTGFELIVDNEDDMTVVASVGDGVAIIDACRSRRVDVVLMDIRMPELDGLAATEQLLAEPDPPHIIILTTFGLDDYVSSALVAGASGFLLKDASADDLVGAIRAVMAGENPITPSLLRVIVDHVRAGGARPSAGSVPGVDELTEREREVLEHLAAGRSNAEIAAALFLSEATVKTHLSRVLAKLGVRDRVQAVIAAFVAGIAEPQLPPDPPAH